MARSMRFSWSRLRAIDIARAVVHGHSTVLVPSLVNIRPLSLPTIGKGFLVNVTEERSGDCWRVFIEASLLEDREVKAWLYHETYSQNGDCKHRYVESRLCRFRDDHGWRAPSSIAPGTVLSDEHIVAPF